MKKCKPLRLSVIACSLLLSLASSGCATVSRAPLPDPAVFPELSPVPPAVSQPRQADFSKRMSSFLFDSPTKPTK